MALTGVQKLCLLVMMVGGLAIIAGSAAPFWAVVDGGIDAQFGAWYFCNGEDCETYPWEEFDFDYFSSWFYVFHVLEGLATLVSLFLVLISLLKMCGDKVSAKDAGGLGLCAGVLGLAAAVICYMKMTESLANILLSKDHVGWAFYVSCCGSSLLTLFSIILLVLPNPSVSVY